MTNSAGYDVIVIGGGIAGTATAWFLAREGLKILVLERGELNARASGANAGSIHLQIPVAEFRNLGRNWAENFAPALAMLRAGARLWAELEDRLGASLEFHGSGGIIAAATEAEMDLVREKAALEAAHGIEMDLLDATGLRQRAPYLSAEMIGGAFYPEEGKANPLLATPAFAARARQRGATIRTHSEVIGVEFGSSFTVHTPHARYVAERVVCAAGADAGRIAAMVGIDLPVRGIPIQVSVTEPASPVIPHLVYSAAGKLTLKQMANGNCVIGGGWPSSMKENGELAVSRDSLVSNMEVARSAVPFLADLRIVRSWPAMVNGTDSWKPIVGEAPALPGFFLCLFPWMGFTAGPIAAQCVSEIICGRRPPVDVGSLCEFPDQ